MREKPPVFAVMEITPDASKNYGVPIAPFFEKMRGFGYEIYALESFPPYVQYISQYEISRFRPGRDLIDVIMIHRPSVDAIRAGELKF
jgi:hypothetical protein